MLKVGYPCITNPSATKLKKVSCDLHASSTPSAFNLNQDQILTEKYLLKTWSFLLTSLYLLQSSFSLEKLHHTSSIIVCLHIVFLILSKHFKTLDGAFVSSLAVLLILASAACLMYNTLLYLSIFAQTESETCRSFYVKHLETISQCIYGYLCHRKTPWSHWIRTF